MIITVVKKRCQRDDDDPKKKKITILERYNENTIENTIFYKIFIKKREIRKKTRFFFEQCLFAVTVTNGIDMKEGKRAQERKMKKKNHTHISIVICW